NFDTYDDFTTDLTPWINIDTHGNNTWGAAGFNFPGETTAFGWKIMNPETTDPAINDNNPAYQGTKYLFSVASNPPPTTGAENKWLISPPMVGSEESVLSFFARSLTHEYGPERIKVYVSTTGTNPEDFVMISTDPFEEVPLNWTEYSYDLGAYAGETMHFAVENVSDDAFMLFLDAFQVTNLVEGGDHVEDFYTATVRLDPGTYDYKYFSDAFGAGWDGGEWEGDPNRSVDIVDHTTIVDIWGDYTADYELSLAANPEEGGTVAGEGTYLEGESVTVSATPAEDFVFLSWTENENVVSTDAEYTFDMPGNDLTLTANFEAIPYYNLSLIADPQEGGTVDGEGAFQAGEEVTVTATPNENHVFVRWTNEGDISVSTNEVYSFTMPAYDLTLTANFELGNSTGDILTGEMAIYPNPFSNSITIANASQVNRVKISNLVGQTVKYLEHSKGDMIQINTSDLPAGIYLIHLTTHEGTQKVSKIVKN
ncbi:MAG: InlB B-repeat-containing protein, partial [Bacteroidota bacterium]